MHPSSSPTSYPTASPTASPSDVGSYIKIAVTFNTSDRPFTTLTPDEQSYFLQDTFEKLAGVYFSVNAQYTLSYLTNSIVDGGIQSVVVDEDVINVTVSFAPYTVSVQVTRVVVDSIMATPLVVYTDEFEGALATLA